MNDSINTPKNPASHLHVLNLMIALVAGLLSIVSGVYSIKANFFTPKTGSLQGVIRDENIAKPLWLVPVEISDANGAVIATINSDREGRYSFNTLHQGNYAVKVSAPLHKVETKDVRIDPSTEATVNFDLLPEQGRSFSSDSSKPEMPVSYNAGNQRAAASPAGYPAENETSPPAQNFRRRSFRRRSYARPTADSSSYPQPETEDQNLQAPLNTANAGQGPSAPSFNNVLTQTLGPMIQDWMSKKTQSKTTT